MFLELSDLHQLFHQCFYLVTPDSDREVIKDSFLKIFLSHNDEEVLQLLKAVKTVLHANPSLFNTLIVDSENIAKGKAFWQMFSVSLDIPRVQKIIIDRMNECKKAIAEIVKPLDETLLEVFFSSNLPKDNSEKNPLFIYSSKLKFLLHAELKTGRIHSEVDAHLFLFNQIAEHPFFKAVTDIDDPELQKSFFDQATAIVEEIYPIFGKSYHGTREEEEARRPSC